MNDKNYIKAFNQLARELLDNPQIELLGYHTFAGLSLPQIEALERQYNCQLDDAIRGFYSQSNGMQLRWMLKKNAHYDSQKYQQMERDTAPVAWDYATENFIHEDGCFFIQPLEEVLRTFVSPDIQQEDVKLEGQNYSNIDFFARLRPFDSFSYYCNMALFLRENKAPLVLMGDEQGSCFTDAKPCTFEAYLHFLIASKALCHRRKGFFGQVRGYQEKTIHSISKKMEQQWSLDRLILGQEFPLADQLGSPVQHIETKKMQAKAFEKAPIQANELEKMIIEHQNFLNSGGIGGEWQIIAIKGQALGVYKGKQHETGQQAIFDMMRLEPSLNVQDLKLPYSSWCGVYASEQDFSDADLTGSIFTDANLERSVFAEANLENVDFSRSNLRGVSFVNANLRGADFENCNLAGADFRGALLDGSQFKGAILKDVLR